MKTITQIYLPTCLNELGSRTNNEDAIFPKQASEESNLFLVCDGVGGQAKGEIASAIICEEFPAYFSKRKVEIKEEGFLAAGLRHVEEQLKASIQEFPEREKMASTLTLFYLDRVKNKALLAWVGDSRIYHIRNGEVLFQTKDHSEVQQLLEMGEISEEEAKDHPRKNVITRAVSGRNASRIDQKLIEDIQENDFFFLCSDGILENLNTPNIKAWFKAVHSAKEIKTNIEENAKGKTKDNYSMYLIKIKKVGSADKLLDDGSMESTEEPRDKRAMFLIGLFLALCLFVYTLWHYIKS